MRRALVSLAVGLGLLYPMAAKADITYSYVTDASSYSGAVGSTVTVSVYLQETVTGSSTSIIGAQNGLYSFGIYVAGSGNSTIQNQSSLSVFTATSSFSANQSSSNTLGSGSGLAANSFDYTATGALNSTSGPTPVSSEILLGTFAVTVGSGTSTYTLQDISQSPGVAGAAGEYSSTLTYPSNNTVILDSNGTADGQSYTGVNSTATTFTVSAVPEPSSVMLTGLMFAGFGYGAYCRRSKHAASAA